MGNQPLQEIIGRIKEKGPITFEEFMDVALYWPEGGYYMTEREIWGKKGDYVTSLDISPVFVRALSKQICQMWRKLGSPEEFHLVEAGAGRASIIEALGSVCEHYREFAGSITVHIVEKNHSLWKSPDKRVRFYSDIDEIQKPLKAGCIISNELMDSLPFHRIICRGKELKEIYTGCRDHVLFDVEGEPSTGKLKKRLKELSTIGITLASDEPLEVCLRAGEWVQKAADLLERGFVVTIDYGMEAKNLYAAERKGTLLCHYRHTMNDNPYHAVGMQDITAHVDFTSLKTAGEKKGLDVTGFTSQRNFLLGTGILDEIKSVGAEEKPFARDYEKIIHNQGIKELIMPGGIGDTMKVLVQHKGIEEPALDGFSFKNLRAYL